MLNLPVKNEEEILPFLKGRTLEDLLLGELDFKVAKFEVSIYDQVSTDSSLVDLPFSYEDYLKEVSVEKAEGYIKNLTNLLEFFSKNHQFFYFSNEFDGIKSDKFEKIKKLTQKDCALFEAAVRGKVRVIFVVLDLELVFYFDQSLTVELYIFNSSEEIKGILFDFQLNYFDKN